MSRISSTSSTKSVINVQKSNELIPRIGHFLRVPGSRLSKAHHFGYFSSCQPGITNLHPELNTYMAYLEVQDT